RAELLHARDRERHRAVSAGRLGDGRTHHEEADQGAALQQPSRLAGDGTDPERGRARGNRGGRRHGDASPAPDLPAVAARAGDTAVPRARTMSVVSVEGIALRFGDRVLWENLSF